MRDQANQSISIESTGLFTSAQTYSLHGHWIETVEQVISVAATDDGREGLAKLLKVDKNALNDILTALSKMLPPEVLEEISQPQPDRPRGVLFPAQQKNRHSSSGKGGER